MYSGHLNMLDFAIFAVTFAVVLIVAVVYLYPGSTRSTTIPGLTPADAKEGNLPDISAAGSFHQFLTTLHQEFGNIASFYYGTQLCVSLASPALWKQHLKVFDKPPDLFLFYQPMVGEGSLLYANKADGRSRRNLHSKCFNDDTMKKYCQAFNTASEEIKDKFSSMSKEEHIPICQYMTALALKTIIKTLFGKYFEDDRKVLELKKNFDICWHEIELRLNEEPTEGSARQKRFEKALENIQTLFCDVRRQCIDKPSSEKDRLFIDTLVASDCSEDEIVSDCITYLVGGFHTTAYLLSWGLYFLATDKDAQEKVSEEVDELLQQDGKIDNGNVNKLIYLNQVVKETLRCSILSPWTARYQDIDVEIGGHIISKNTPVMHALGVVLQDEAVWPEPKKFDPERFSADNSKDFDDVAFSPFGFAGRRTCPGSKYATIEAVIFLAELCHKFKWHMVEGQVVESKYGLVTHPKEEIWVTISKR
ncbi:cytochrome P450 20A1-like [Saccoglossus kowalevskii]|uniref:Cytochrome P450 20A1-like n=1 Tax=Saccoglossus kowalevskii TaxID=10224 RepID=A0ABM0MZH8_SACKO|nr:PREDICTED: cytochrome P450 20A1-like [Saccoglossus kowalevskii]